MRYIFLALCLACSACSIKAPRTNKSLVVKPVFITDSTRYDTDDPAIWVNPQDVNKSLIIGTDKNQDGALYVYDLKGKVIENKVVRNLQRPNNCDVAYGLMLAGKPTDYVIATERLSNKLRAYSLPDMRPIDNGGIPVFEGTDLRAPMGIAIYTRPSDKKQFAVVSRSKGPEDGTYLWQYELYDDGKGHIAGKLVRKFGQFSGKKEIESIAVDNENGYIYYSDEGFGVRQYVADPADKLNASKQLACFAQTGFAEDHEGISIYKTGPKTGYILVSDQGADKFHIFSREGDAGNALIHKELRIVEVSAIHSDGSDIVSLNLGSKFPKGLFVTMSEGKVFHYYDCRDILGN